MELQLDIDLDNPGPQTVYEGRVAARLTQCPQWVQDMVLCAGPKDIAERKSDA